jgi:hypothetical protein
MLPSFDLVLCKINKQTNNNCISVIALSGCEMIYLSQLSPRNLPEEKKDLRLRENYFE